MSTEIKILTGISLATIAIVIGAAFFFGGTQGPKEEKKLTKEELQKLVTKDSHRIGDKKAPISIVEFGDYQCPACGAAHSVVNKILKEYQGKISYVFRHFPLSQHQNAEVAAEAAESAGAQGKFFEMHNLLYDKQQEWSEDNNPVDNYFVGYAKTLELDVDKFKKDIEANAYKKTIQQGISAGNALGLTATPTFFINDEKVTGGLPYNQFKEKIDAALKAAK